MKIAVRYQSHGNNTKTVADIIAQTLGVRAEPIDTPLDDVVDVLFVGGGVYKWDIDPSLKTYLEKLRVENVKSIAAFSTAGGMDGTKKMCKIAKSKGIMVHNESLPIKVGVKNHAWLGGKGHITLKENKRQVIEDFSKKIVEQAIAFGE